MRLPIDVKLLPSEETVSEENVDEAISVLLQSRDVVFSKAQTNIKTTQKQQKEMHDCKHKHEQLAEGSQGLLGNTAQRQWKGGKMINYGLVHTSVTSILEKDFWMGM